MSLSRKQNRHIVFADLRQISLSDKISTTVAMVPRRNIQNGKRTNRALKSLYEKTVAVPSCLTYIQVTRNTNYSNTRNSSNACNTNIIIVLPAHELNATRHVQRLRIITTVTTSAVKTAGSTNTYHSHLLMVTTAVSLPISPPDKKKRAPYSPHELVTRSIHRLVAVGIRCTATTTTVVQCA